VEARLRLRLRLTSGVAGAFASPPRWPALVLALEPALGLGPLGLVLGPPG
jgi:hypothetical protein